MRRSVSFYETRIELSDDRRGAIHELLGESAESFLHKALLAAGEYRAVAAAWAGPPPADVRKAIEALGSACANVHTLIGSLPAAAGEQIRQAQAIDASRSQATDSRAEPRHPSLYGSMDTTLDDLQVHLVRIGSACARAATFGHLNTGRGQEPDYARRALVRHLAEAYTTATGKQPARRSDGHFARVAQIILQAVGADSGISNDLLVGALGHPSGKYG